MKCPTDGATLVMSERSGIEIDYCPDCRGVWLDRGELDKILDRAVAESGPASAPRAVPQQQIPPQPAPPQAYGRYYDDSDKRHYGGGYKKRKGHWLSEIFD